MLYSAMGKLTTQTLAQSQAGIFSEDSPVIVQLEKDMHTNWHKIIAAFAITCAAAWNASVGSPVASNLLDSGLESQASQQQTVFQQLTLPEFSAPYPKSSNDALREDRVYWTGGPHSTPWLSDVARIPVALGSALDFSSGAPASSPKKNFQVLAMAPGLLVEASCEGYGNFGCVVAVKHAVGGSVLVYAHLDKASMRPIMLLHSTFSEKGVLVPIAQGAPLGMAGNTYNQEHIHLHIDLRRGNQNDEGEWQCRSEPNCLPKNLGGDALPWGEGTPIIEGYRVFSYIDVSEGANFRNGEGPTWAFNYDGSAVRGAVKVLNPGAFYYSDFGTPFRTGIIRVHETFKCMYPEDDQKSCENPEYNTNPDQATVFATSEKFYEFNELDASLPIDSNEIKSTRTASSVGFFISAIREGVLGDVLSEAVRELRGDLDTSIQEARNNVELRAEEWVEDQISKLDRSLEMWMQERTEELTRSLETKLYDWLVETCLAGPQTMAAASIVAIPMILRRMKKKR